LNANAAAAAVIAKRDAELRALYVVVPPSNEATSGKSEKFLPDLTHLFCG
jgi:hypothetical protein